MQWEYYRLSVDGPSVENALHELGLSGWELVSVLPESRIFFGYQCFLKRPISDANGKPIERAPDKRPVTHVPEARRLNPYLDT
jgi:hypothetical protein